MGWTGTDPSQWADNAEKRTTALLRNSVQALANEAASTIPNGGRVPVKTGNLSRSVVIDTKPPQVAAPGQEFSAQNFSLGVAQIMPGDTIYIGWTAVYARRQNYGFTGEDSLGRSYNQAGHAFAEAAAAKWSQIVRAEAAKLGAR